MGRIHLPKLPTGAFSLVRENGREKSKKIRLTPSWTTAQEGGGQKFKGDFDVVAILPSSYLEEGAILW